MKKLLILAIAAALPFVASAKKKVSEGGRASISFTETVYDFGAVSEKRGAVSHEFGFINAGNGNLVITDVKAECGCTRPEYDKTPIAPGKKSKVKVTYNPLGRPGPFERTVTVKTNGKPGKTSLKITGTVVE